MGSFNFLSKKKGPADETSSSDMGVPMPSTSDAPDIYSDLPSFSEKSTGDELLPPLKPILRDTSMPGITSAPPTIMEEKSPMPDEELPVPPQLKGYDEEEIAPQQPYTVPSIPAEPEQQALPEPPAITEEPVQPDLPVMQSPAPANIGPFVKAYELRQILKDTNDLHSSIKLAQDIALIKEILDDDSAAYDRFHKSIEALQRKLMLAEKMFMKV